MQPLMQGVLVEAVLSVWPGLLYLGVLASVYAASSSHCSKTSSIKAACTDVQTCL